MKSLNFIRNGKSVLVEPTDIIRFEARSNYTCVFFKDQPPLLMAKVLRIYNELLRPHGFIRIHRSHLINTDYVNDFDRKGIIHKILPMQELREAKDGKYSNCFVRDFNQKKQV